MSSAGRRLVVALLAFACAAVAVPQAAMASTVQLVFFSSGKEVNFAAGSTESDANNVVVTFDAGGSASGDEFFRVRDDGAPIDTVRNGCSRVSANEAKCPAGGVNEIDMRGGAGGDVLKNDTSTPALLVGDGGADSLYGGSGNDSLHEGNTGGADRFFGRAGDDRVRPGTEDDFVSGGAGAGDTAEFTSSVWNGVTVVLDDVANDGKGDGGDMDVGSDVENLVGSGGPDTFVANPLSPTPHTFRGSASTAPTDGDDTLEGGFGSDVLIGGRGGDRLNGRYGADKLHGQWGDDVMLGGPGPDAFNGGSEADVVSYEDHSAGVVVRLDGSNNDGNSTDGSSGNRDNVPIGTEIVVGTDDFDILHGSSIRDVLAGQGGPDFVSGHDGHDDVQGGDDNDSLDGGPGADMVRGGGGEDGVTYASRTAAVDVSLDDDNNDGESGESDNVLADVERILGGSGGDTLSGDADANLLSGGPGFDVLQGRGGPDELRGGDGAHDVASYSEREGGVVADIDGATDDGNSADGSSGARDNVRTDVEHLVGGSGADKLTGNDGLNRLTGGAGADTLSGLAGVDSLDGGPGPDGMDGGDGEDNADYTNRAAAVNVTIDGVANDGQSGEADNVQTNIENVRGGSGSDFLRGDGDPNYLEGNDGDDILRGGGDGDVLAAGDGTDQQHGEEGDDSLRRGRGPDTITGGPGDDTVSYFGAFADITVTLDGKANDGSSGEADNVAKTVENVTGGFGDDTLTGNEFANRLSGGSGGDTITGKGAADTLNGDTGDDKIDAQDGVADSVSCGAGAADSADLDAQDGAAPDCEVTF